MVPDKPQKVENFHFTWCGYIGIRTRYYVNRTSSGNFSISNSVNFNIFWSNFFDKQVYPLVHWSVSLKVIKGLLVKNFKWGFRDNEKRKYLCYCFPIVAVATLLYLNNTTSTAGAVAKGLIHHQLRIEKTKQMSNTFGNICEIKKRKMSEFELELLPDEVLLRVLRYLPTKDLIGCRQVSKPWVAKVRARTHVCDVRSHVCVCVRKDL